MLVFLETALEIYFPTFQLRNIEKREKKREKKEKKKRKKKRAL